MKNFGLHILALTGILFAAQAASAGVLIEPFLGYATGTISANAKTDGSDVGGSTTGTELGLRLGYKLPILLWFAGDYSMNSGGNFSPSKSGAKSYGWDTTDLYLDVGIDLPVLLRLWAGYGIQNQQVTDSTPSETISGGTNFKFGVGFTFLPLVSVNVEYKSYDPSDSEGSGRTDSIGTVYKGYSASSTVVSVSLPLDL